MAKATKSPTTNTIKSLFDHLNAITTVQNPKYWETLTESDRKTWSNFMVFRFVSMNPDWIELIADIQPYLQEAPPRAVYKALSSLLPKGRYYLKYMKRTNSGDDGEPWVIEMIAKYYEISLSESGEYYHILNKSEKGKSHIKEIAVKYGIDSKIIAKIK